MKVLLIQSPLGRKQELTFPIGLACLATALQNHDLTAFDPSAAEQPQLEMQRTLEKNHPDIIGVSLRNVDTTQSWDVYSYFEVFAQSVKKIREIEPYAKIVAGGAGFSMFPQEIMKRVPEIDYGVFLEGERTFPILLRNLNHPERVPGVYFKRGNKLLFTGCSELVDFSGLPLPKRDIPGLSPKKYRKASYSIGIQTKRGCAHRCSYCTYPLIQGKQVRTRAPRRVVDEIEQVRDLFDTDEFVFADTVFNFPPEHSRKICKEIIERKLEVKWKAWFREDVLNKASVIEAVKAGCQLFEFSPDGGSQEALDILQKDMTTRDVMKMCEIASQIRGVNVAFNFMCNVPGETPGTIARFMKLLTSITAKCREKLQWLGLTRIRIYPNTEMCRIAQRQRIINSETDLLNPTFYDPAPFNILYSLALSAFDRKNILALLSPRTVQRRLAAKGGNF